MLGLLRAGGAVVRNLNREFDNRLLPLLEQNGYRILSHGIEERSVHIPAASFGGAAMPESDHYVLDQGVEKQETLSELREAIIKLSARLYVPVAQKV